MKNPWIVVKHCLLFLCGLSILVGLGRFQVANAQSENWVDITPPGAANLNSIAVHPINSGELVAVGSNANGDAAAFYSNDAGVSWTDISGDLDDPNQLTVVAIAPTDTNAIYAAGYSNLYRTTDGGDNWELIHTVNETTGGSINPDANRATAITFGIQSTPTEVWVSFYGQLTNESYVAPDGGVEYAIGIGGIWRGLSDDSVQWERRDTGIINSEKIRDIAIEPQNASHLLASSSGGSFFFSTDSGTTWQQSSDNSSTAHILVDPQSNRVTRATVGSVTVSNDAFVSPETDVEWTSYFDGIESVSLARLAFDPESDDANRTLYGLKASAVYAYVSYDAGVTWKQMENFGLPSTATNVDLETAGGLIYAALEDKGLHKLQAAAILIPMDEPNPVVPAALEEVTVNAGDNEQTVTVSPGQFLSITLESLPAAGLFWEAAPGGSGMAMNGGVALFHSGRAYFTEVTPIPQADVVDYAGQKKYQQFVFYPLQEGQTFIGLNYKRPDGTILDQFTVIVDAVGDFSNVTIPSPPPVAQGSLPTVGPNSAPPLASAANLSAVSTLPSSFSWCDEGGCTPVKDQSSCGSCWAFTAVGVMESNIKIRDGVERDLSEQHLLSCNDDNDTCNGGWYGHALEYYHDEMTTAGTGPGTVFEVDFAYANQVQACPATLTHHETVQDVMTNMNWPDVATIKQAIHDYGPVGTSLCVGPAFQKYQSGVYRTEESSHCPNSRYKTNHAVVIVGWDDADGAWIIRNSWGPNWGEDGYIRVQYGTSSVGSRIAYVLYQGANPATPAAPTGLTATPENSGGAYQIDLAWSDNSNDETGFTVLRDEGSGPQAIATLPADSTTYTDATITCNQRYQYSVKSTNAQGDSVIPSNIVEAAANCADLLPPTDFAIKATNDGVEINWTVNNATQDGTQILRWNQEFGAWEEIAVVRGQGSQFIDKAALNSEQTYYYTIRAVLNGQYSQAPEQLNVVIPRQHLNAPMGLTATIVSEGSIELAWQDNSQIEDSFAIYWYESAAETWLVTDIVPTDTASYTATNLDCDKGPYQYFVTAKRGLDESGLSNIVKSEACSTFRSNDDAGIDLYMPLIAR